MRNKPLHPTLNSRIRDTLYGYTSKEEGIRHALLSQSDPPVGQNEALFMLSGLRRAFSITGRLGAVLPCYKEVDGDGTPYCANCFENFKKSILFCSSVANSRMFSYSCVSCGLKIDRL